jgi:nucleotide-binding universal stress UspA family protein
MKVLLATDGSEDSKAAVNEVANRLFPPKTKVWIVCAYEKMLLVTDLGAMGVSQEYNIEVESIALIASTKITKDAAKIISKKNPDLIIKTMALEGSAKSVILEQAKIIDADLIIVGSHGYGAVERFLLGSVSQEVAVHAKCSVEIVRKKK